MAPRIQGFTILIYFTLDLHSKTVLVKGHCDNSVNSVHVTADITIQFELRLNPHRLTLEF